jgi:hypothetical protein
MAKEVGLLDEGGIEILRCAQDDSQGFVILSAAKDLCRAFVQQTRLTSPWGHMGNHQQYNSCSNNFI